jgi:dimethylargininase
MNAQFKKAIVRKPGRSLTQGISSANLGKPDYEQALKQHQQYIDSLEQCQVEVTVLSAEEQYPDSVFVEDTAVLTEKCAIISFPGALSRQGEEKKTQNILSRFFLNIECIRPPGTLEGGDVMQVGNHFYIGLSERTNPEGARQLTRILKKFEYSTTLVPLSNILHLKSELSYLENNNLLITRKFINFPIFEKFNKIVVDDSEKYSANSIWINGTVLVPAGFKKTAETIKSAGYRVLELNVSEFRKLDGGLSCLSLRF